MSYGSKHGIWYPPHWFMALFWFASICWNIHTGGERWLLAFFGWAMGTQMNYNSKCPICAEAKREEESKA